MTYDWLTFAAHGLVDLPWWGYLVLTLVLTHVTIASVTIFLHRAQAHRGLDLHPIVSHFFRFWLWLTTGMVTKEWVAIHRKHHAKVETPDDPHSPQTRGIETVFWKGTELYRDESENQETLAKYGHGTPDDWIERNLYSRYTWQGVGLMMAVNLLLFGPVGLSIWAVQMVWIPITAAGIINGIGHYWGYRNFACADASTNIVPWGIIIGGEELHNNHHAYGTSAKLSSQWYEFDIGWMYIRILAAFKLATVRKVAPQIKFDRTKVAPRPRDPAGRDHPSLSHRHELRALGQGCLRFRAHEPQGACGTHRPAEPGPHEALAPRRSFDDLGIGSRQAHRRAREEQGARDHLRHAPGSGLAVGALDRIVRATPGPPAGLVPPRRSLGHRAPAAVFAQVEAIRVAVEVDIGPARRARAGPDG
jgi:fatty-acid desaturase